MITAVPLLVLIPLGVLPVGVGVRVLPHLPLVQVVYSKADWLLWQVVLAPAVTAYLIWAWGWAGVPRGAVKPSERNKDGSFRVTPDEEKVSLTVSQPEAKPEAGDAEQKPVKRVVRRVRLAQPQEQEPVGISDLDPDELPPDIAPLLRRQAIAIGNADWDATLALLQHAPTPLAQSWIDRPPVRMGAAITAATVPVLAGIRAALSSPAAHITVA